MLVRILIVAAIVIFLVAPAITTSAGTIHAICRSSKPCPAARAWTRSIASSSRREGSAMRVSASKCPKEGEGLDPERAGARATLARRTYGYSRPVFTRRLESPG